MSHFIFDFTIITYMSALFFTSCIAACCHEKSYYLYYDDICRLIYTHANTTTLIHWQLTFSIDFTSIFYFSLIELLIDALSYMLLYAMSFLRLSNTSILRHTPQRRIYVYIKILSLFHTLLILLFFLSRAMSYFSFPRPSSILEPPPSGFIGA